jgi:hypothetical protein
MSAKWIGCPPANFRKGRPFGFHPEAIVIHVMDGSFASGEAEFLNANSQKSAHYGISKTGEVHQYVHETDTAFHAGIVVNPTWRLLKPGVNPNFYTIGIEHEGRASDEWPEAQMKASATLVAQIASVWQIPLDTQHVIKHREIRASKTCPGNWLTSTQRLLDLIAHANGPAKPKCGIVRLLRSANLREGCPNTRAPIVRILSASTRVAVSGFVTGETVSNNPFWYVDADGYYFWAGTTDVPSPTAAQ